MNKTFELTAATTTAQMLEFFNANSGLAPVARFADRKSAEKRVAKLLATLEAGAAATTTNGATVSRKAATAGDAPKVANGMFPAAKAEAKAAKAPAKKAKGAKGDDAATRLYKVVALETLKRGAIQEVCAALAGKKFTRETFVEELTKIASVRALGHFYWAKAHNVIAPVDAAK